MAPTDYLGISSIPELQMHEKDRTLQRTVVCVAATIVWAIEGWIGRLELDLCWLGLTISISYLLANLAYRGLSDLSRAASSAWFYLFILADPLFFTSVLALDPRTFAFLHPFVLVIVVRTGIRYGLPAMYCSWVPALAGALLLLTTRYWRTEIELTLSFFSMLLCVPLFFSSLIRRIHNVRKIEQERAHFEALNEIVVARSAFLAKVSHELRSPLQGIVSALDVLALRRGAAAPTPTASSSAASGALPCS